MQKWEYKHIPLDDKELEVLGRQGWELVTVTVDPKAHTDPLDRKSVYYPLTAHLKRPLGN